MVKEEHSWALESPKTIKTRTGSLNALTAMYIDIWQRIAEDQRKKKKLGSGIDITK